MTFSGGEPLSQPKFAQHLLKKCHDLNIHTVIETCGLVVQSAFEQILLFTDLFLFDIKHLDSHIHQRLTGASNELINSNLHWLHKKSAHVIIRLPLVPGMNMDIENLHPLAELVNELGIEEINLMPFHQMGKDKYLHLGKNYQLSEKIDLRLDEEGRKNLLSVQEFLKSEKVSVTIGG